MKKFKYELHCHTNVGSRCANISPKKLVKLYEKLGYAGLCVTDHLTGNTEFPDSIPWEKRINLFCQGYEDALAEGEKIGLDVFFGWEYTAVAGIDFLVYGLDKKWLLENPQIDGMHFSEYLKFIAANGGFIAQAHPFREASYIPMIGLAPDKSHGVEVYNANGRDIENDRAKWYANSYNLIEIAGSDTHTLSQENFACMESDEKLEDIHSLISSIKSNKLKICKLNS